MPAVLSSLSSGSDTLLSATVAPTTTVMDIYLTLANLMVSGLIVQVKKEREGKAEEGKKRERKERWKGKERRRILKTEI